MKVGDILYFVDISLGKVTKHKINTIKVNNSFTRGDYDVLVFTGIKAYAFKSDILLNPTSETYFHSHTKMRNSNKTYLVFTEAENAYESLVNYVLPRILEKKIQLSNELRESYFTSIEEVAKFESELKKSKDSCDKKCNALKNKFV